MRGFIAAIAITGVAAGASAQSTIYFADFEANDGGWMAGGAGDWAWGTPSTYDPNNFPNKNSGNGGISSGNSGTNVWATVLDGPHHNQNPSASSTLTQRFDFSNLTDITLSWFEYLDSGGNSFDMATVQVNGDQLYLGSGDVPAWTQQSVDLNAYAGLSNVEINFDFFATTVVGRDGWYIDDVRITAIPAPGALALLGLGGLMAARRRR